MPSFNRVGVPGLIKPSCENKKTFCEMSRSQPDIDPGQATLRRKASFASKCPGFTSNAAAPGAA